FPFGAGIEIGASANAERGTRPAKASSTNCGYERARGFSRAIRRSLTRDALVVVLGSQAFQQLDRLREGLNALDRTVLHVDSRSALPADSHHVGALRDQVLDHLVVAAGRRVMEGGVPLVVGRIDVDMQLVNEVLHGRKLTSRREPMRIRGEPLTVA